MSIVDHVYRGIPHARPVYNPNFVPGFFKPHIYMRNGKLLVLVPFFKRQQDNYWKAVSYCAVKNHDNPITH